MDMKVLTLVIFNICLVENQNKIKQDVVYKIFLTVIIVTYFSAIILFLIIFNSMQNSCLLPAKQVEYQPCS